VRETAPGTAGVSESCDAAIAVTGIGTQLFLLVDDLVSLSLNTLSLRLAEVALLSLLGGAGFGVLGMGLVGHRVVAGLLLLVGCLGPFRQPEVLGWQLLPFLRAEVCHLAHLFRYVRLPSVYPASASLSM
jgi:hypothetical protein